MSACHSPVIHALSLGVPISILSASLMGSGHCAGMCGGLAAAMSPTRGAAVLYHLGRGLGYAGLGLASGWAGDAFLSNTGAFSILTVISTAVLAFTLLFMGISIWKGQAPHLPGSRLLSQVYIFISTKILRTRKALALRHFTAGLLTLFLPCGWLYGFVAGAAATASPIGGALFMTVFWMGTLPSLGAAAFAVNRGLFAKIRNPRLAGALFMATGVLTLFLRIL